MLRNEVEAAKARSAFLESNARPDEVRIEQARVAATQGPPGVGQGPSGTHSPARPLPCPSAEDQRQGRRVGWPRFDRARRHPGRHQPLLCPSVCRRDGRPARRSGHVCQDHPGCPAQSRIVGPRRPPQSRAWIAKACGATERPSVTTQRPARCGSNSSPALLWCWGCGWM